MDRLTDALNFDARYIVLPVIALIAAGVVRFILLRILRKWTNKTKTEIDDKVVLYLESLVTPVLLLCILYYLVKLLPLKLSVIQYTRDGILVAAIFLLAFHTAKLLSSILKIYESRSENMKRFLQPLHILVNITFALIALFLTLRTFDLSIYNQGGRIVRILGIIIGAYVALRIVNLAVAQMERLVSDEDAVTMSETEKRARTLGKIINSAGFVLIIGIALMMIMSEFNMDIMPIITGAGIAGLAIGFGAQNLVRDVISGFFLILEDQIRVGDVARINGTAGVVEAIKLRTTVLRDLEGVVHIFPNGEITQVSNLTKEFSYFVLNVGIAYKENVDNVMEILKDVGEELQQDSEFSKLVMEPLEILGVDDFADSQVTIKIRIKTLPLKQWLVGRELRRRIKNTFDSLGIEIPFPHRSIYFGEASKPFSILSQAQSRDSCESPGSGSTDSD
ncbi:MAG: mechanosensitive ion channel family protein [Acidobacteriota bacterium]